MWSMRQDDDYRRGRHVVSALNVQLLFVTKHRRGLPTGEHLGTLGEMFASACADFGAELVEMDGEDDQVHLLVAIRPTSRSPGW
jgi:putative transposase